MLRSSKACELLTRTNNGRGRRNRESEERPRKEERAQPTHLLLAPCLSPVHLAPTAVTREVRPGEGEEGRLFLCFRTPQLKEADPSLSALRPSSSSSSLTSTCIIPPQAPAQTIKLAIFFSTSSADERPSSETCFSTPRSVDEVVVKDGGGDGRRAEVVGGEEKGREEMEGDFEWEWEGREREQHKSVQGLDAIS